MRSLLLLTGTIALLLVGAVLQPLQPAGADTPDPGTTLRVEQRLLCPTCTNLRLDLCDLAICADMRRLIAEKLAAGETEDRVVEYFVARFGERILAEPPRSGFHLVAWILPPVIVAGSGLAAFLLLRHWRRRSAGHGTDEADDAPATYRERVRAEVERFQQEEPPWP